MTPVSNCSVCDVDEAFSDGGSYTIFEVESRFDGNLESRVKLVGVKPFVMKYAVERMHERRQVFLEVMALFRHINMPVHVAKRVILPSVSSNPSPSFIRSVVDAFRSGVRRQTYSGGCGNLGAQL